jgi:putative oxidoreductase
MLSSRLSGPVLSAFRVVVGLLFACHGAASLFGVLGGVGGTGATVGFAAWPGWWAAVIEFVGGSLVLVGLLTRPAAIVCSGSMAYAYFAVHQPRSLWPLNNGGELAVLFCWSFLSIAVLGAGAWSLDGLISRRRSNRHRPTAATTAKWQDDAARNLHRHGAEHVSETLGGRRTRMEHHDGTVGAPSVAWRSTRRPSRVSRTAPHRGQRAAGPQSFRRTRSPH